MALSSSLLAPLRQPVFRRIWLASLLSNLGLLIQGVGSAWAMIQMTATPAMVALVQSALMLPTMFFSVAAGALADMYDRRKVAMCALCISLSGASILVVVSHLHWMSPAILLLFCFVIGSGQALFGPAWQSSVSEQVPPDALASAVGLNSVSYNIARSVGPAVGGAIVAFAGAIAAFAVNACCYVPLLTVLLLWRRVREIPRLPPERLLEAVASGVRYVKHSPPIRIVLARTATTGMSGGVILALLPIVARQTLHGDARIYGLLLGLFGVGAILGALGLSAGRGRADAESIVRLDTLVLAAAVAVIGASRWLPLTGLALVIAGTSWLSLANIFNVSIQMSAPRWVAGRALAMYQASISGGVAVGSWCWGLLTGATNVSVALLCAAGVLAILPLLARWFPMPTLKADFREMGTSRDEPRIALALAERSGPIVVTVEYRVDPEAAREFYSAIQELQLSRRRNGARDWSVARDIDDPWVWTERFQCATWLDYLRHRDRPTRLELELQQRVVAFHVGKRAVRVRRMLGRPFGSVRWKADAPDTKSNTYINQLPGAT